MTPEINIRPLVPKRTPRSLSRVKNQDSPRSPLSQSESRESSVSPLKRKRETVSSPLKQKVEVHISSKESQAAKSLSREHNGPPLKLKREEETEQESPFDSSTLDAEPSHLPTPPAKKARTRSIVKAEVSHLDFSAASTSSSRTSREASVETSGTDGQTGTDATSVDDDTIIVQPIVKSAIPNARKPRGRKQPGPLEQSKSGETILVGNTTSLQHPAVEDEGSVLSDLESQAFEDVDFEDSSITPRSTRGNKKRKIPDSSQESESPAVKKRKKRASTPVMDKDHAPQVRIPGDYVLTPALLAHPTSAWINCKICEEPFVHDGR